MTNKYLKDEMSAEVKNWINTTLKAFLKKNPEDVNEIEHILDFLTSDKAPQRLQKMSYKQAKEQAEKWTKSLQKKGANLLEDDGDVKVIFRSKRTGMKYVQLVGENAFKREGSMMRHCVASYYGRNGVEIFSLRDADNEPHCTIEIDMRSNTVNQIKGKANGAISPKYIRYVMRILRLYHKMDIRDSEMKNLGYTTLENDFVKLIVEVYGVEPKHIDFRGKKYYFLASIQEIDRRETEKEQKALSEGGR